MKVLWFTNTLSFTDGLDNLRFGGGWMQALLERLLQVEDVQVGIVSALRTKRPEHRVVGDIDIFTVPQGSETTGRGEKRALKRCAEIVEQWQPDVLHIHGTERFFGLVTASGLVNTPTVMSLQGLMQPYSEWLSNFGNVSLWDTVCMHRFADPFLARGVYWSYWRTVRAGRRELEIVRKNRHFLGRTTWDRAWVDAVNPSASYHHVGELLREPFWQGEWDVHRAKRHRILFTNANHPRKGVEVLLEAVKLLTADYPDLTVGLAGNISRRSGYGRYVRRRLRQFGDRIIELGPRNATELRQDLQDSHVFVSTSWIDNSPNALCEAQLVGVPVIASYVGGVPSLIKEGETGLFFPPGDAPVLAARIKQLFENDQLAERLGRQGRLAASKRHAGDTVTGQLLEAYQHALQS